MGYLVECQCDECANYIRIELGMDTLRQAIRSEDIFGYRCPYCKTTDTVFYPCRIIMPDGSEMDAIKFILLAGGGE